MWLPSGVESATRMIKNCPSMQTTMDSPSTAGTNQPGVPSSVKLSPGESSGGTYASSVIASLRFSGLYVVSTFTLSSQTGEVAKFGQIRITGLSASSNSREVSEAHDYNRFRAPVGNAEAQEVDYSFVFLPTIRLRTGLR